MSNEISAGALLKHAKATLYVEHYILSEKVIAIVFSVVSMVCKPNVMAVEKIDLLDLLSLVMEGKCYIKGVRRGKILEYDCVFVLLSYTPVMPFSDTYDPAHSMFAKHQNRYVKLQVKWAVTGSLLQRVLCFVCMGIRAYKSASVSRNAAHTYSVINLSIVQESSFYNIIYWRKITYRDLR